MIDLLTIGLTAGSGLLNMLGNATAAKQQRDRLNRYVQSLDQTKINPIERINRLLDIERGLNAESADLANSTLIDYAISDARNTSNLRSKLAAKLLGEKTKVTTDASMKMDEFNKQIDLAKAQAELQMPAYGIGNALVDLGTGAIAGFQTAQTLRLLDKYLNENNKNEEGSEEDITFKISGIPQKTDVNLADYYKGNVLNQPMELPRIDISDLLANLPNTRNFNTKNLSSSIPSQKRNETKSINKNKLQQPLTPPISTQKISTEPTIDYEDMVLKLHNTKLIDSNYDYFNNISFVKSSRDKGTYINKELTLNSTVDSLKKQREKLDRLLAK